MNAHSHTFFTSTWRDSRLPVTPEAEFYAATRAAEALPIDPLAPLYREAPPSIFVKTTQEARR